jgi:cytochrome bd ubiquinol oxidase subunit II
MSLETLWFVVVAVFWTGFFLLEGFDFGVGVLHTVVGRDEEERRVAINAIGPFWDGNEVWLIVAGAAMFAAFPGWYATMFSALYLGLLLVLLALIARGVSFEFGGKMRSPHWRRLWTWCTTLGSAAIPLVLGIGLGDLVAGLPVDSSHEFTGSVADIFTPYGLAVGLTLLALCALHGATFLALKTEGAVRSRARTLAVRLGVLAAVATAVLAVWSVMALAALAVLAVVAAAALARAGREGWAFVASAAAMAATVASLFVDLYPQLLASSTNPAYSLTVSGTASGSYALKVMTVAAAILFPVVLLYQGWTYHVFRARVAAPVSRRHDSA